MANYGYGPFAKDWDENKKPQLVGLLSYLIGKMNRDGAFTKIDINDRPYIKLDGDRVNIEKLTQLPTELQEELISKADKVYISLMHSKAATFANKMQERLESS